MKYAEKVAREAVANASGVSLPWVEALIKRVLEDAAKEADETAASFRRCRHPENKDTTTEDACEATARCIRALADREVPETGTPGSQP
jgi:hypothetical protein